MADSRPTVRVPWDREQLAWAAGFYDGEGSLTLVKGKKGKTRQFYRLNMNVAQTNLAVLQRLQTVLQCGTIYGPYRQNRANRKSYWQWHVDSFPNIQFMVCCLWPWLSAPKREQAKTALLAYQAYCAEPKLKSGPIPKGEPAK